MKNNQWLSDILTDIEKLKSPVWQGYEKRKFFYHPLYRVGLSSRSTPTLKALFGEDTHARIKNLAGNLRKFDWIKAPYTSIEAALPEDSVIFFQEKRQRLIIASFSEKKVLKISTLEGQLKLLKGEITLLKFLQDTSFKTHTANLIDYGDKWIITSFCSNRDSLLQEKVPVAYLLENMHELIMEPMAKFYQTHNPQVLTLEEWLQEAKLRMSGHPNSELLNKLIAAIQKEMKGPDELKLLLVQLHFDLHAENILRDRDLISVIDWEVTTKGLALIDFFDFYRRYLKTDRREGRNLYKYLKKEREAPSKLESFFKKFLNWQNDFDLKTTNDSMRLYFYLYALERTLIYYEKWGENRMADERGFEFKIAQSTV